MRREWKMMMVSSRSQRNTLCRENKSRLELRYSRHGIATKEQVLELILWLAAVYFTRYEQQLSYRLNIFNSSVYCSGVYLLPQKYSLWLFGQTISKASLTFIVIKVKFRVQMKRAQLR